ncbi:ATP-binding protein [Nonomuraea zeae]|uniref:ATP-binding protein n=1 Tax=Nonomuraea zeae TaxID=1642303 RepID=A0A5S4FT90_9ACTN|nr:ATP-binding protein [Nonomuraea zeae]TMR23976.1 ATP-binding protein [Nonomuraea zeae]
MRRHEDKTGYDTLGDSLGLSISISADLAAARDLVRDYATSAGMPADRVDLLVLAVNEAVTNVLDHGGQGGTLSACADGTGVVVAVVDNAGLLRSEHLHRPMEAHPTRGMGLYVIRRVCDHIRLDHPDGRSRLRLFMGFSAP